MSKRLLKIVPKGKVKAYIHLAILIVTKALAVLFIAGCASEFNPPSDTTPGENLAAASPSSKSGEALVFVSNKGDGSVSVIKHNHDENKVIETVGVGLNPADIVGTTHNHIFVNVTDNNIVAVIDPKDNHPSLQKNIAVGNRPIHSYRDPEGTRVWVMNDGDSTNGNDTINCGSSGASVTVIQNHDDGSGDNHDSDNNDTNPGEVIASICVGRGHHKAAFSYPSSNLHNTPHRVFISNIKDGTISVIDNDPTSANYLKLIATIDLCDPAKESGGCDADINTRNNSAPHGIDFSPLSGKVYNSNTRYGTIAVIDPITNTIEKSIDVGFVGKAHVSHDGRFLIVMGSDTKKDINHVIGKLTVIDVNDNTIANQIDLQDVYPDSFLFIPDSSKLYVASATQGSGNQLANLKNNIVLVFDTKILPNAVLIKEISVGVAKGGHRAIASHPEHEKVEHIFVPNPSDNTVSIIKVESDTVVETLAVGKDPSSITVFTFKDEDDHDHNE